MIKRTSITIPESLYELARNRMAETHFSNFSDYICQLIRDDTTPDIPMDLQQAVQICQEYGAKYNPQITDRVSDIAEELVDIASPGPPPTPAVDAPNAPASTPEPDAQQGTTSQPSAPKRARRKRASK
tara:strand:- start:1501 stop:1884 length:384 start_codon:yes stop_codon:yes gene_type:complete